MRRSSISRGRAALILATALGGLAPPGAALAATFGAEFTSTTGSGTPGGTSIDAEIGDLLKLDIVLTPESGVDLYGVSIEFSFEVDAAFYEHTAPPGWDGSTATLTNESEPEDPPDPAVTGVIDGFNAFDPSGVGVSGGVPIKIGEVWFNVGEQPQINGDDIVIVLHTCTNPSGGGCTTLIHAQINPVPEPGTGLSLALGLTALAAWRRRAHA